IGAAFPDLSAQEYDHIEDGDTLAIRGRAEGTHTGRFLGLEPTGQRASWEFADLYRVGADGRINWHFYVTDWNIVRLQLLGEAPGVGGGSGPARHTRAPRRVRGGLGAVQAAVQGGALPEVVYPGRVTHRDVALEQAYVSMLYEHLDGLRDRTSERLAQALRQ